MATTYGSYRIAIREEIADLRSSWLSFTLLGVSLVLLGFVALGGVAITGLATALAIGALLVISGFLEAVGAFWAVRWGGFWYQLLSGILSVVLGILFLKTPLEGLLVLTLLLASFLLVGGIFKMVAAATHRFEAWIWPTMSGAIDIVLGILVYAGWPVSAFWVIGMFVGICLILRGFNWIGLGMALRSLPG